MKCVSEGHNITSDSFVFLIVLVASKLQPTSVSDVLCVCMLEATVMVLCVCMFEATVMVLCVCMFVGNSEEVADMKFVSVNLNRLALHP